VHWPDLDVPFAETADGLGQLVAEGKIRHIGVSNFTPAQIEEFARSLPVETLQPLYSLLNREPEGDVMPYCEEHDVGVLAYGPLAHGLLTGAMDSGTRFESDDWRRVSPSLTGETFHRNLTVVERLGAFAEGRGDKLSQLAIAWVLQHAAVDVAIVGSRRRAHIEESLGALELTLSPEDNAELDRIVAGAVTIEEATAETMTELMGLA